MLELNEIGLSFSVDKQDAILFDTSMTTNQAVEFVKKLVPDFFRYLHEVHSTSGEFELKDGSDEEDDDEEADEDDDTGHEKKEILHSLPWVLVGRTMRRLAVVTSAPSGTVFRLLRGRTSSHVAEFVLYIGEWPVGWCMSHFC